MTLSAAPLRARYSTATRAFETAYQRSVTVQRAHVLAAAAVEAFRDYFADGKGSKKEKSSKDSKKDKDDKKNEKDRKGDDNDGDKDDPT